MVFETAGLFEEAPKIFLPPLARCTVTVLLANRSLKDAPRRGTGRQSREHSVLQEQSRGS